MEKTIGSRPSPSRLLWYLLSAALLCWAVDTHGQPRDRRPNWDVYERSLLDVKFRDEARIRHRRGRPQGISGTGAMAAELAAIEQSLPGSAWRRSHSVAENVLAEIRARGMARSGRNLPDLESYQRLTLAPGLDAWQAKQIVLRSPAVEGAYYVPKPPPSPAAPDYSLATTVPYQGYLDAAPAGIDARYAWSLFWDGPGISICNVEYDFNHTHVDLPTIIRIGEQEDDPFHDDNHGTAVFGEMVGLNDSEGVRGIASQAGPNYFSPANTFAHDYDVARAIVECVAALEPGDVVLIEQQTPGPNFAGNGQVGLVPTEWDKPVYDAVRTAVANGIVVVETSGNGSQDLDAEEYSMDHDEHWPFLAENDSGAIIVTGGSSSVPHGPLGFTNYGSTVDLQGWGEDIVTTGYGALYSAEGRNVWYRQDFGGSSGAGPIVAGAVAALQGGYKALTGTVLPPAQVRSLLRSTGTAGGGVLASAPLPDLRRAILSLLNVIHVDENATGANDGSSWTDAYTWLPDAMAAAGPGTMIMVAKGFYFPAYLDGPRTSAFELKNGLALLGGFPTGGGERDPAAHLTHLSGHTGAGQAYNSPNDAYHVVTADGTDRTAILDGFVIIGGTATGTAPHDSGGGILIRNGSPTIRNTIVTTSVASNGAGAFVSGGAPSFVDVRFERNSASGFGGGIYHIDGSVLLNRVTFDRNQVTGATAEGGGLFSAGAASTPLAYDVRFYGNTAYRGGAIANWPGSALRVDNAIFSGNHASDIGGAVLNFLAGSGSLRLTNTSFAGNEAGAGSAMYAFDPATIDFSVVWGNSGQALAGPGPVTVSNSLVQGGYPGSENTDGDPKFRDADGADSTVGTPDDDLRLDADSIAIDRAVSDCLPADIEGHIRIGRCDYGAHEYLGNPGNLWSNGEVDARATGESADRTPVGGTIRQSADDFLVAPGEACLIERVRGVLADPSEIREATIEIFADAGNKPGALLQSFTASGSESLGGTMREYELGNAGVTLQAGTYWVSIYGKQESDGTGRPSAVSAGEGTTRGNPYQFREVGAIWVDGGTFHGHDPHDLALDIDGSCGCGTDAYCDDGNPDTVDACNNLTCSNEIPPPPANDDLQNVVAVRAGTYNGTLLGASRDGSSTAGMPDGKDVWYSYTASTAVRVSFNTCGTHDATTLDTVLSLHGGGGTAATELDANDDWPDSASEPTACSGVETSEPFRDSALSRILMTGETVNIRVAQYSTATNGDFVLNIIERPMVPARGLNLYAPTVEVGTGVESCFALLSYLGGATRVESVTWVDTATQRTTGCRYSGTLPAGVDFALELGSAYFVQLTPRGALGSGPPPGCPAMDLVHGINLVGVGMPGEFLSCLDVLGAFGPAVVSTVERLDGERETFEACFFAGDTPAGLDFPIRRGEGYLVHARNPSSGINLNDLTHPLCQETL